jgi:hypothetical protein
LQQVHSLIQPFVIRFFPQATLHYFLTFSYRLFHQPQHRAVKALSLLHFTNPPNSIPGFGNLSLQFHSKLYFNPVQLSYTCFLLPSISGKFLKSLHSIHPVCSVPQSHRISFSPSLDIKLCFIFLPYCLPHKLFTTYIHHFDFIEYLKSRYIIVLPPKLSA